MRELLKIERQPFDYQYLTDILKDYRYPRNKISSLLKKGDLISLKRGLYMLSDDYGKKISPELTANLLYGPSYISLEYALSRYGIIPEEVFEITSVTTGRKKYYQTPIGNFSYRTLKAEYFGIAYQLWQGENGGYLIASAEKALCDKLYLSPAQEDFAAFEIFLNEGLRINESVIRAFDLNLISRLAELSGSKNILFLKEFLR